MTPATMAILFFFWEDEIHYPTLVSPLCKFILDRIERYHEDEITLQKALPILTCKRPRCQRLIVAKRAGRQEYCCDNCRAHHRQEIKTASGEQKDYAWLYRLEGSRQVGRKLKKPKVLRRLSLIEVKWPRHAARAEGFLERAEKANRIREQTSKKIKVRI
jgi:hypothetical protein